MIKHALTIVILELVIASLLFASGAFILHLLLLALCVLLFPENISDRRYQIEDYLLECEHGKRQVDAAQMREIVKCLSELRDTKGITWINNRL